MASSKDSTAFSDDARAFDEAVSQVRAASLSPNAAISLLKRMTDAEKLTLLAGNKPFVSGILEWGRYWHNYSPVVAAACPRLGIPGIRFTDGPKGICMYQSSAFPVAIARGATWDETLEREVGAAIGAEGRAQGATLWAGCCVNVIRHPGWGRTQETYSEDPVLLGKMGVAIMRGMHDAGMMVCTKHFAANSIDNARFFLDVKVSEKDLHEVYLPHFKTIVDAGVDSVMSAYNSVNGERCGDSKTLLSDILRDEWDFKGFVMSDFALGLRDPVGSVGNGQDLEMPFAQQRICTLPAALADGRLDIKHLDRACLRLLEGQIKHAVRVTDKAPPVSIVASQAHRDLARKVAARATVLLKNDAADGASTTQKLLPVDAKSVQRLTVFGELADVSALGDKTGSSTVHPPFACTPLDGLKEGFSASKVEYDRGSDLAKAKQLASSADLAIVIVGTRTEGENMEQGMGSEEFSLFPAPLRWAPGFFSGLYRSLNYAKSKLGFGDPNGDRRTLGLPEQDVELIKAVAAANKKTVVIVLAGSVVTMPWRDQVPAVVLAWFGGMEAGRAIADVLTGRMEPGGRMPLVIPEDEKDLGEFDPECTVVEYGRWWGQRLLDKEGKKVAFPLGFGLGYTDFAASGLSATRVEGMKGSAKVQVKNVGARSGATVVQVYGHAKEVAYEGSRPRRELLGFKLIALDAGSEQSVEVELDLKPLFTRIGKDRWELRTPGLHVIEAGQYCADPKAAAVELNLRRSRAASKSRGTKSRAQAPRTPSVPPTAPMEPTSAGTYAHRDNETPTPPPLVPKRAADAPFDPNFLLAYQGQNDAAGTNTTKTGAGQEIDFARPASVARSGEPAISADHDPVAIATLDRYVAHPHALGGRSTLAQTLPVRGTSPGALEAAYHLEAIARHIDKLKDAGILREDSHSSSYAGTGAFARAGTGTGTAIGRAANPGVAESIARSRTPGVGSIRTPSPANGTSSTPAPAGGEGYEPASGTNGSPDTAINIDNAQQVADVSQAEIAPPVKSKDHDINAGNVLEGIINRLGVNKSHIPWDKTLFLGILAGFFTFCGGAFAISTGGGLPPAFRLEYPGVPKLIIGATFPFIVLFGGELFTGNTMILLVAFFNKKVTFTAVLLNWLLVYLGNMASCFFCSYVFGYVTQIFISPIYQDYLVGVANLKTSLPWYIIFLRAIPANALVCLSIFLGLAARDVMGKLAGLWIPIFCFAAIGYEHCIANMTFITLGLYYNPPGLTATWGGFWYNQSAALLGNVIGGGLIIGGSEWAMYHWSSFSEPIRHAGKWGRAPFPSVPAIDIDPQNKTSNEMIKETFAAGMAELDPSMAIVRAPTLLSTSDPVVDRSGRMADGRAATVTDLYRAETSLFASPQAYRRATVTFSGLPAAPNTFSEVPLHIPLPLGSRPTLIVDEAPNSPTSLHAAKTQ